MAFRLEKLLSLRKKEEEALKEELNKIRRLIKEVEEEIVKAEKSRNDIENQLRTGSQNGAQLGFLLYLLKMSNDYINYLVSKLNDLKREEDQTLHSFLEKRTERKTFEKLKDRYLEIQRMKIDRRERSAIDEVALQKYFQNRSE
ncbi:MAG: flagellar export protein FliJ [Fervidobacterium sp.]